MDQKKELKEATKKRVEMYQNKEIEMKRDIEMLKQENKQLKLQGANLQRTVTQREEIHELMKGKNNMQRKTEIEDLNSKEANFKNNPAYKRAM